jgi:hypothetical protein
LVVSSSSYPAHVVHSVGLAIELPLFRLPFRIPTTFRLGILHDEVADEVLQFSGSFIPNLPRDIRVATEFDSNVAVLAHAWCREVKLVSCACDG